MNRYIFYLSLLLLVVLAGTAAAAPVQVTNMRWSVMPDTDTAKITRLVLDIDGPYEISAASFSRSPKNQLTAGGVFRNLALGKDVSGSCNMKTENVSAIALAPAGSDLKLQVTFPAKSDSTSLNVFVLREDKANNKPWRIVIDIIKPLPQQLLKPANPVKLSAADYGVQKITDIRWSMLPDVNGQKKIRVVFDLSGPYRTNAELTQSLVPSLQLQAVFEKLQLSDKVRKTINFGDSVARSITLAQAGSNSVRVTVPLSRQLQEGCYSLFILREDSANGKPWRIVMDIAKPVPVSGIKFAPGLKGKRICIDPGHGGSDPGAIGPGGTFEANVTLPVAMQLKTMLEKAGCSVYMSRVDDRDVCAPNADAADELQARVDVADKNKADVFLCIHADSFMDPSVGGTGTYYFPKTNLDGLLAAEVQENTVKQLELENRGVNRANFYVLKYTQMPAVLIELGFISNPDEEKKLADADFEKKAATGIVNGLSSFFDKAAALAKGR